MKGFKLHFSLIFVLILSSAFANIAQSDSNKSKYVKWSQPPVPWQETNTYIGWDEPSFLDEAYYAQWITVGQPDCWSKTCPHQCHGDADCATEGKAQLRISTLDLDILRSCWGTSYPDFGYVSGCSCADFDRDGDVDDDDQDILMTWYGVPEVPGDCPQLFGPVLAADDFYYNSNKPITAIRWWGSFDNWRNNEIPAGNLPNAFHITIWTDVLTGMDTDYSHPGKIIWENYCDNYDINFFSYEFDPRIQQTDLAKYEFYQELEPKDYWYQPGDVNTYWLGIMALYNQEPNFVWGWETRPHLYNDDAVRFFGRPELDTNYPTEMFEPVKFDSNSWDLCFELISNPKTPNDANMDLGDAPDSTNNFSVPMTAYPGIQAKYPTVYMAGSPPYGPIHWQPHAVAYLGDSVSLEAEADIGPDSDVLNNIDPNNNASNRDSADDGVLNIAYFMSHYPGVTFYYRVTVMTPNVPLYVNAWFDWNCDGDWDDVLDWCDRPAPEWAVKNQALKFNASGVYKVKSSPFTTWVPREPNESFPGDLWMRITLSEQPWIGSGVAGSGPANGYQFGETEDYHFEPLFPLHCMGLSHTDFCDWLEIGFLECWCYPRQCHGDADGYPYGKSNYWVSVTDLAILKNAWNKNANQLVGNEACADFDRIPYGKKNYRVSIPDLQILKANWKISNGPDPNCSPGNTQPH